MKFLLSSMSLEAPKYCPILSNSPTPVLFGIVRITPSHSPRPVRPRVLGTPPLKNALWDSKCYHHVRSPLPAFAVQRSADCIHPDHAILTNMQETQLRTAFFLLLLSGVLVLVFFILQPYLITLSIAATAAVILYPIYNVLLSKLKERKTIAAFCMVALTILLLLVPLTFFGIQIATEATDVYRALQGEDSASFLKDVIGMVEGLAQQYIPATVSFDLNRYAGQALNWIASNLQSFFAGTLRAVLLIFLGIVAYFYMLRDGKSFTKALTELSPLAEDEDRKILDRLRQAMNSVIRGSLIIAILQGIVTGIGLAIFGIPSAVLLGSIAGVGALIPSVGTSIILAPVIIYLFVTGEYFSAVGLLLWGAFAVGLIDNFLHPLLVGRGMKMHPMFVFFAVIGGIAFFGISGFILGPLIMSLLFGLLEIFRNTIKPNATLTAPDRQGFG